MLLTSSTILVALITRKVVVQFQQIIIRYKTFFLVISIKFFRITYYSDDQNIIYYNIFGQN